MVWHRAAQSISPEARQREDVTFTVQEHHCALKYLYGTKSTAHFEPGKCFCWWWRTVSYATYNKNKLVSIGRNWLYKSIASSSVFLTLSGSVRLEKANSKALPRRGSFVGSSKWQCWDTGSCWKRALKHWAALFMVTLTNKDCHTAELLFRGIQGQQSSDALCKITRGTK